MQCWTHFGAPLYPSYAWMCACINQGCTKQRCLTKVASILLQSFYQGYYGYEDMGFDDFNSIKTLTNDKLSWS